MIRFSGSMIKAVKISAWLKERGYVHDIDYTWRMDSPAKQIIFTCKNPKMETLMALHWMEHE